MSSASPAPTQVCSPDETVTHTTPGKARVRVSTAPSSTSAPGRPRPKKSRDVLKEGKDGLQKEGKVGLQKESKVGLQKEHKAAAQKEGKAGAQKSAKPTQGRNQKLGKRGEDMACVYLEDNNITILERNWQCNCGEVDIIAVENEVLVFIEVKTRSKSYPGLPEYAVTAEKRGRYERLALAYLTNNQRPSGRVRFDVIAIRMTGEQQCLLRHHRDAFGLGD